MQDFIFIYITCRNVEEARQIGKSLVQDRLVACINILNNVESIYCWNDKIEEDTEVILIAKSNLSLYQEIEQRVKSLHSYTNPCIIYYKIDGGSKIYLDWINHSIHRGT